MDRPQPKPWVLAIDPYVPGRARGGIKPAVKLSANETPLGPSPKAVAAFQAEAQGLHRYPEGSSAVLREALGAFHGINPAQIICGDGSDEVLGFITQAFAGPGDEVIFTRHGFMVYPIAARRVGALPVTAPDKEYTTDIDAILASVTPKTKVVFIANPNNPTGTYISDAEVMRLHRGLRKDVILVLDEAYAEYVERGDFGGGLNLAQDAANVVVTRTFSKIYGLAGARLGWGFASAAIIDALHRVRPPFNVTSATAAAGVAALQDQEWIDLARGHNNKWLAWLTKEVTAMGLRVIPSVCNFILIKFPQNNGLTAEAANQFLTENGYLLRWLPNQGLGDCLRLTVGLEEENKGVIEVMRRFLKEVKA